MPRGGRKIRGNYQWLPCVKAYLATTFPEWVSYSEIITNTELLSPTANYRYLINLRYVLLIVNLLCVLGAMKKLRIGLMIIILDFGG